MRNQKFIVLEAIDGTGPMVVNAENISLVFSERHDMSKREDGTVTMVQMQYAEDGAYSRFRVKETPMQVARLLWQG